MKNRLECSVTTCLHNSNNLCDLPSIKVEGPGARCSSQTCCESFEERSQRSSNSVSGYSSPSPETSIDCKAHNCVYNDNCKCEAECVCVGCCCQDATSKSGTECCTFQEG
ncbi:DUF1540 domain-containing protein [Acutalibacter sp. 1XD8-33]|uniref:DUF1540 domain-containing protein n=1 Tax=Acutalibacter sp. 1XD8-33 TaxID=2320081 RepID=UPI000EA1410A|nr:DUF1540 domain-containing protein [Acutalibacter sp. 1XD8-33]RKJ42013.1 DUF1540 domain-containing protein [Acutalibacter sp. 1XD8-33]